MVVDNLIQRGDATVTVLETPDRWFGVTYREDKPRVVAAVSDMVAEGVYPAELWQ